MREEISYMNKKAIYRDFAQAILKQAKKDSKGVKNALQALEVRDFINSSYFERICDIADVDRKNRREWILGDLNKYYTRKVFKNSVINYFSSECNYDKDHIINVCYNLSFIKKKVKTRSYSGFFTEKEILCIKKNLEK